MIAADDMFHVDNIKGHVHGNYQYAHQMKSLWLFELKQKLRALLVIFGVIQGDVPELCGHSKVTDGENDELFDEFVVPNDFFVLSWFKVFWRLWRIPNRSQLHDVSYREVLVFLVDIFSLLTGVHVFWGRKIIEQALGVVDLDVVTD